MEIIGVLLLGIAIGAVACYFALKSKTQGIIRVARSEEDNETYLFLEMKPSGLEKVTSQKFVTFEVSQK